MLRLLYFEFYSVPHFYSYFMASKNLKTARVIAVNVLNRFDPKHNYAGPILDELLNQTNEKQRATDLVFGTIRNRSTIDTTITIFTNRLVKQIPKSLLNIIRVAVLEIIYSPDTPEYSIVNEAVENSKTVGGKKQVGFVNAVLRQITGHIKSRQSRLSEADPRKTLAQTPQFGCEFDRCFLPNPKTSPADYFSIVFSLPKWLVTDWLGEFGVECTQQICFASNRRPSIYIRPNTLKITIQELAEKLSQAGINATIEAEMIKLQSPRAITELPGFAEGLFTVQDITASQAVRLLQPQPDWTILDLCAAPGVKTTQLAELTGDSAKIIATDINSNRLKMVEGNTSRLGIKSASIITYEQLEHQAMEVGPFDAILLDVPCSNTGVLAKRIEMRYRLSAKAVKDLTKTQGDLLDNAAVMIKPGGKICYSTCSIQKAENNLLIKKFLQKHPNLTLELERLILPSADEFDRDGGYAAIITESKS
jgi:16S rRNA (cytosine967-C5)-methyltransferase